VIDLFERGLFIVTIVIRYLSDPLVMGIAEAYSSRVSAFVNVAASRRPSFDDECDCFF